MLLNVYGRRESGKNLFIHTTMKESKKKKRKVEFFLFVKL